LERERNLLRTLIDNLPDAVFVKDRECRFLVANIKACELIGVPNVESLVGKTDFDFYAPETAARFAEDEQALMHSGQALIKDEEEYYELGTDKPRWNSTAKVPLRDSKGEIIGLVGIAHDFTERKEMEQALRHSEELYRAIVEDQTELICRIQPNFVVTFVNEAYCRYFGVTREECVGKTFMPRVYPEDQDMLAQHVAALGTEVSSSIIEHRAVTPDGRIRWLQWNDRVIYDQQNQLLEIQGV